MRILIVEDEQEIADGISTILETEGYITTTASDGQTGLDEILSGIYDLILLDIMLPKRNGLEILSEIRQNDIAVPVILLTALSQTGDKITGLDCGADDYLTKPFDADELLARIRARLRRKDQPVSTALSFADIQLEQSSQKLCGTDKSVKLARKEYQLLECLMQNQGQIIPRETLILKIWGYDDESEYNQLDVYISFVRKKMKFVESQAKIVTTKGVGYSLEGT
ncbi:MAG: response regulator transcription factor [Oscillospiraceae bacterium]|nr:response regulator transcription factor [Oscillospiraceae bacterium]